MTEADSAPKTNPKPAGSALLEQANSEYDAGNYERALKLFDEVLKEGFSTEVVYNNRGAANDALGRSGEAVEDYLKAVSINGKYELAWHNLANSLFAQEMYDDAVDAYEKAASLNSTRKENWSGLALGYIKLGKTNRARNAIGRLDKPAREDDKLLLVQADLYLDAGLHELAENTCRKYIEKHPDDVDGYAHLGSVEHEIGDYGKAIDSFEKALKLSPNDKELWNNLGYTCFVGGFFDRAIECFDKAIAIDPLYKQAWYNKGYANHGADLLERAVECYGRAIAIDSNDSVLWNNYGNALYNLGRYAESIPKYVEAILIDPDYEIAWNNIGNALEKMGEYAEAIPYHDRSLEICPDFDYALYAKGVCKAETGKLEEGYDLVLESLALNPDYEEAWMARSSIASRMGRMDDALLAIDESLAVSPEFDEGWIERGELLLQMQEFEAAEASFEMALDCLEKVHPHTASGLAAVVRRGEVLVRLGRFEDALMNIESVALSGRMNSDIVLKALELRRFMGKTELPRAVMDVIHKARDPRILGACAGFLIDAGHLEEAERVVSAMKDGLECGVGKAKLLARIHVARGDAPSALKVLESLGTEVPEADLLMIQGEALEAKGEAGKAVESFRKVLALNPSDFLAALEAARSLLKAGDAQDCIEFADIAIGIDSNDWEPHRLKADAYALVKDGGRSKAEMAEARRLLVRAGLTPEELVGG